MAYVKQGPWTQGSILSAAQATAMDDGIAGAQATVAVDLGSVSGAVTLDATVAAVFTASLSADATISVANIHQAGVAVSVTLMLTPNAHVVTFDAAILFSAGQPGTLTGAPDLLRFIGLPGGTVVYGQLVQAF